MEQYLDVRKIPRLEFEMHLEQLVKCIREITDYSKQHYKTITRLKKEMDMRPNEIAICDALMMVYAGVEIDSGLLRLVGKGDVSSRAKGSEETGANGEKLKKTAVALGNRIGEVSDCLKLVWQRLAAIYSRQYKNETDNKNQLNDKFSLLQSQIGELSKSNSKQLTMMEQSLQTATNQFDNKLREMYTKTLWQIGECKNRLNDKVSEQMVKDAVRETEGRLMTLVKEQNLAKLSVAPERIDGLYAVLSKLYKAFALKLGECEAKVKHLSEHLQSSFISKKDANEDRLATEKTLYNYQHSLSYCTRKQWTMYSYAKESRDEVKQVIEQHETLAKYVAVVGKLVNNLKLGDYFRKLMEKLDPHKICYMDSRIDLVAGREDRMEKEVELLKGYVYTLRSKNDVCNLLAPRHTTGNWYLGKEEMQRLIQEVLSSNNQMKKIPQLECQAVYCRGHLYSINELNKRMTRMQKDFDIQSVIYGLKGLEEYTKKELLLMNTRLLLVEGALKEERRRPMSAKKTIETRMGSSVSYKKLVPVDCISCFGNPLTDKLQVSLGTSLPRRN